MNVLRIRNELRSGKTIFDLPLRVTFYARVSTDKDEQLKFGFRQAIKNGHVLGNDQLWGYDKKDCVLTVNEEEARAVRRIFDLYANRHILCNPKYKGWYCAGKSQTVDYRSKRKIFLDEDEWVTYPDPSIPAIVSEELWDRANALYKRRSKQMMSHQSGAAFHNRYPYSGKIVCREHGPASTGRF